MTIIVGLLFSLFLTSALSLETKSMLGDTEFRSRLAREYVNAVPGAVISKEFGHIEYEDLATNAFTIFCEGAVLRPDVIISVAECETTITTTLVPPAQYKLYYTTGTGAAKQRYEINRVFVRKPFILLELDTTASSSPMGFTQSTSPFLTWAPDRESEYVLPYETFDRYNVYFAPTTRNDIAINNALNMAKFADKADAIALQVTSGAFPPNKVYPGAAFYKYVDNRVVLMGFYSEDVSSSCSRKRKNSEVNLGLNAKVAKGVYLCGYMMTKRRRDQIMDVANALGKNFFSDQDLFHDGTIIGTMNINGVAKMGRNLGKELAETIVNVIAETDIMAFQEAANLGTTVEFLTAFTAKFGAGGTKQIIYDGQFAFAYDSSRYALKNPCQTKKTPTGKGPFALKCSFEAVGFMPVKEIAFYSAHFTYKDQTARNNEQKYMENLLSVKTGPMVILGDFNIKRTQQSKEVAYFYLTHFTDYGPSSIGSEHFDRILLLEEHYLNHAPYFPNAEQTSAAQIDTDVLNKVYKKFYPTDPTSTPATPLYEPEICAAQISDHLPVFFTENSMLVATWNLKNYAAANPKFNQLFYVGKVIKRFDIVALQEMGGGTNGKWNDKTLVVPAPLPAAPKYPSMDQAFCYDSSKVNPPVCDNVYFVNTKQRPAFFCSFYDSSNALLFHIANLHILNAQKSFQELKLMSNELKSYYTMKGLMGKLYIVGDFNLEFVAKRTAYECNQERHPLYYYSRMSSKKFLDHVIEANIAQTADVDNTGVAGCMTYDYEYDPNVILRRRRSEQAKAFCAWEEISDHYPVFSKINVPKKKTSIQSPKIW